MMNKTSPEILELRKQVEICLNRKIKTPKDFDFLRTAIWEKNHEVISTTTLKRLWGYVSGADKARLSTLDILSRLLGHKDWDDFLRHIDCCGSDPLLSFHISTDSLHIGDRIKVSWMPDRHCVFRYLGNAMFIVEKAENSKLKVGDTFCASLFILGEPLYLSNLVQDGKAPVPFVVGSRGGLCELELL
jgi:hypothetical protein